MKVSVVITAYNKEDDSLSSEDFKFSCKATADNDSSYFLVGHGYGYKSGGEKDKASGKHWSGGEATGTVVDLGSMATSSCITRYAFYDEDMHMGDWEADEHQAFDMYDKGFFGCVLYTIS